MNKLTNRLITSTSLESQERNSLRDSIEDARAKGRLPLDKKIFVFMRQSKGEGANGEGGGNVMEQRELRPALISAGIAPEQIVELEEINKSGALTTKERKQFAMLKAAVLSDELCAVIAQETARISRDPHGEEPAEFANGLGKHNVVLIRAKAGTFSCLYMETREAKSLFRKEVEDAASDRFNTTHRLSSSKQNYAEMGAASSLPTPFGFRRLPPVRRMFAADGQYHPPRFAPDARASEVLIRILKEAVLPHINSATQLRRHLLKLGPDYWFCPFTPETVEYDLTRSVLWRCWITENGERRHVRPKETFLPKTQALMGAILNPMIIGDLWYGSGKSGHYKMEAERARLPDHQQCYAQISEGKEFVGNDPTLNILAGNEQLFYDVLGKFERINYREARDRGVIDWREGGINLPLNEEREQRKKSPGKAKGTALKNHWAGKVYCMRHGRDKTGEWVKSHPMRQVSGKYEVWTCYKENSEGESSTQCQLVGGLNLIGRVLDSYLTSTISDWLTQNIDFLSSMTEQRDQAKARAGKLEEELASLREELAANTAAMQALARVYASFPPDAAEKELDSYTAANIRPLANVIRSKEREIVEAEASGLMTPSALSNFELRQQLSHALEHWYSMSVQQRQYVVELFIEGVHVLTGDGLSSQEVLMEIKWKNTAPRYDSEPDVLVCWKNSGKDLRPWTEAEEAHLKATWSATHNTDHADILVGLEPGRKFPKILRKATEMHLLDQSRSREWQIACIAADRTPYERYGADGLLYMSRVTDAVTFEAYGEHNLLRISHVEKLGDMMDIKSWQAAHGIRFYKWKEGNVPFAGTFTPEEELNLRCNLLLLLADVSPELYHQLTLDESNPKNQSAPLPFCPVRRGRAGVCFGNRKG